MSLVAYLDVVRGHFSLETEMEDKTLLGTYRDDVYLRVVIEEALTVVSIGENPLLKREVNCDLDNHQG